MSDTRKRQEGATHESPRRILESGVTYCRICGEPTGSEMTVCDRCDREYQDEHDARAGGQAMSDDARSELSEALEEALPKIVDLARRGYYEAAKQAIRALYAAAKQQGVDEYRAEQREKLIELGRAGTGPEAPAAAPGGKAVREVVR